MARRRITATEHGASPDKIMRSRALRQAMTPAEQRLWEALRRDAIGMRVRRQHVIRGWIADFYLPAARLVIEVDGDVHELQAEEDQRRTEALEAEGLRVIRFANAEVMEELPRVVAVIVGWVVGR